MSAALGHSTAFLTTPLGDCRTLPFWSEAGPTPSAPPPPPPSSTARSTFWQRNRVRPAPATPVPPKPASTAPVSQRLSTPTTITAAAATVIDPPLACSHCRLPILQKQYLCLNDGRPWHLECLLCCQCRHPLGMESRCYVREGKVYCKYDYQRLLAITPASQKSHKSCKRCSRLLCTDELIVRTPLHVFHSDCFRCIHCSCILKPGDRYVLINEFPLCLRDLPLNSGGAYPTPQPETVKPFDSSASGTRLPIPGPVKPEAGVVTVDPSRTPAEFAPVSLNIATTARGLVSGHSEASHHRNSPRRHLISPPKSQKPEPQPPSPPPLSSTAYLVNEPTNYFGQAFIPKFPPPPRRNRKRRGAFPACLNRAYDDAMEGLCLNAMARQKRIRTSFKHSQLRAMKAFFAINHNPDGKDLKVLSERTGLSKRVLQVWFQNARAKFRRSVLRPTQNCLTSLDSTNTNCSDGQHVSTILSEPTAAQGHDARFNQSGDDNLSCVLSDEPRTVNSEDPEALEQYALNDSFLDSAQEPFLGTNDSGLCEEDADVVRQRPRSKPREENELSEFFGSSPLPLLILDQSRYT